MATVSSPAYLYDFTFVPEAQRPEVPGAPHGSEIGPLVGHAEDPDALEMGHLMREYWIQFARTGDPNGPGRPEWPAYDAATDLWLVIDRDTVTRPGVLRERLDSLEARYLERVAGGAP
jgi:para-nitrobenzyl esterase